MTIRFIADTNVLVSAQLVAHPQAPPLRIWEAILSRRFEHVVSSASIQELNQVLKRPNVAGRHGLSPTEVDDLVAALRKVSELAEPVATSAQAPDHGDQFLWNLLSSDPDLLLVTGDPQLLTSTDFPDGILSPRQFCDRYLD